MIVSILILGSSAVGLLLWFHAACQALVREQEATPYSAQVAEANELHYLTLRRALEGDPGACGAEFARCLAKLEHDYEAFTYLLRNAATLYIGRYTPRERALVLDFQFLRFVVRLKNALCWPGTEKHLLEMTRILEFFGATVGHRLATFHAANRP